MTKTDALWAVMDAARETRRASESGVLDLSEQKQSWRAAVDVARESGATESEIKEAEKEGSE